MGQLYPSHMQDFLKIFNVLGGHIGAQRALAVAEGHLLGPEHFTNSYLIIVSHQNMFLKIETWSKSGLIFFKGWLF